jgi:hypothetical protein
MIHTLFNSASERSTQFVLRLDANLLSTFRGFSVVSYWPMCTFCLIFVYSLSTLFSQDLLSHCNTFFCYLAHISRVFLPHTSLLRLEKWSHSAASELRAQLVSVEAWDYRNGPISGTGREWADKNPMGVLPLIPDPHSARRFSRGVPAPAEGEKAKALTDRLCLGLLLYTAVQRSPARLDGKPESQRLKFSVFCQATHDTSAFGWTPNPYPSMAHEKKGAHHPLVFSQNLRPFLVNLSILEYQITQHMYSMTV